ncbi:MAG TPA: conjugal transfer protein TraD [Sphingomonadaceae bacterium]|nr:conjugal transfer protein TraD [Sphingomonadaceae bacterium]
MRKLHDYASELKALADKAKRLRDRQVRQLGELVVACRADALDAEVLAGALLAAATASDTATTEGWRKAGAAFFRTPTRSDARGPHSRARSASSDGGGAQSAAGETGAV